MKYEWIDAYLTKKPGVVRDLQKDWNWMRYQIGGKMFAAVCRDDDDRPVYITMKLDPVEGDFWRGQYADIIPGYYMNKTHWNSVKADGEVPDDVLRDLLDKSYRIVLGSLSRKKQREIAQNGTPRDLISCCGSDCGACSYYGGLCTGCNAACGKVFHAPEGKACPIYACCRERSGFSSCGECDRLPCALILATKDPNLSEEEFLKTVDERVKRLRGE